VTLGQLADHREAVASYDRAIAIGLEGEYLVDAWHNRGCDLSKNNRNVEALASFEKAIELDPQCFDAWVSKGWVLLQMDQYADAILALDRAAAINPQDPKVWHYKGEALRKMHEQEKADDCFRHSEMLETQATMQAKEK
jgi:tetratricopeptide (TPR) repeat protein